MNKQAPTPAQQRTLNLDRPSACVPSIDIPWDDPADRAHRLERLARDRSSHRQHHALYEDMLN